jgi:hypothetical protein
MVSTRGQFTIRRLMIWVGIAALGSWALARFLGGDDNERTLIYLMIMVPGFFVGGIFLVAWVASKMARLSASNTRKNDHPFN